MAGSVIRIDTGGSLERVQSSLSRLPSGVDRARIRAMRKLAAWVQRQVLREAASAAGTSQQTITSLHRYSVRATDTGLVIWIGTNPVKAHHLGTVKWSPPTKGGRRTADAQVGKRRFPHAWAWNKGKTQGLVMQRIGAFGRNGNPRRERIDVVRVPIDDPVRSRIEKMRPEIAAQMQALFLQEINYAIRQEMSA